MKISGKLGSVLTFLAVLAIYALINVVLYMSLDNKFDWLPSLIGFSIGYIGTGVFLSMRKRSKQDKKI